MLAIGQHELDGNEDIKDTIKCPHCKCIHDIKYGEEVMKDGTKVPSKLLAFYNCGENSYLAGINGKKI